MLVELTKEIASFEVSAGLDQLFLFKLMASIVANAENLNTLAATFFREFSRAEYCLKITGNYVHESRDAKANWSAIASEMDLHFSSCDDQELEKAIQYILENPPKKQIIKNGCLQWDHVLPTSQSKSELVLLLVRRVRNNLFHGGKFNGQWFEPERSEMLLESALKILMACVTLHPRLKEAYDGASC